jgi:hypothetical protein
VTIACRETSSVVAARFGINKRNTKTRRIEGEMSNVLADAWDGEISANDLARRSWEKFRARPFVVLFKIAAVTI